MLIKICSILSGWYNFLMGITVPEAERRAAICQRCPSISKSEVLYRIMTDKGIRTVSGKVCGECNCPISSKVRSQKEKCPRNLW